jgi:hypothetical protein
LRQGLPAADQAVALTALASAASTVTALRLNAVGCQHPAVLQRDALRAKQQLGRPGIERAGVDIQQMAQDRLHHRVDEQRRQRDATLAEQAAVKRFQRAGGHHAVAQRDQQAVVLTRVGIRQGGQVSQRHRAQRVSAQGLVQAGLGPAAFSHQGQLGAIWPVQPPGWCRYQVAAFIAGEMGITAGGPEIEHGHSVLVRLRWQD